jgi:hypothetical protein
MSGSNIFAIEKNATSPFGYSVTNYFATKAGPPTRKDSQDGVKFVGAQSVSGVLAASFTKNINGSCDFNDLRILSGWNTPVIWLVSLLS